MFKCLNVKMNKGFTLVEMLVSISIFSIIIGAATGVFASAIKLQRYSLTHQQLLDQTSYAMEYMSRAIRMAQKDNNTCIPSTTMTYADTASGHGVKFRNYKGECIEFVGESEASGEYWLKAIKYGSDPYNLPLIATGDFEISSIRFQVVDSVGFQPKVTIFMEVQGKGPAPQPRLKIQTTISQRNLNM